MPATDYEPTLEQVGARIRARTRSTNGNELGTFTENTRPTADEVNQIIVMALSDIAADIGAEIPDGEAREAAQSLASLYVAMQVELSCFADEVRKGQSPYDELAELYKNRVPGVKRAADIARSNSGDDGSDVGESAVMPVSSFPQNAGGLVGNRTVF